MVASPIVLKSASNATNVGRVSSAVYALAGTAESVGMATISLPLTSEIAPELMDKKVSLVDVDRASSCLIALISLSLNIK
jgi:hypothetical protein